MNRNFILLLIPMLIIPIIFLIFVFSTPSQIKIVVYLILPIVEFGTLAFLALKVKMNLTIKWLVISLLIGFLYLPLTLITIHKFYVPQVLKPVGGFAPILIPVYKELMRNSLILGFMYLSFVTSWFSSKYVNKKLFKIIIFIVVGIFISYILTNVATIISNLFIW